MKLKFTGLPFTFLFLFTTITNNIAQNWTWATSWGCGPSTPTSNSVGDPTAISTDPSGNILITGIYQGTIMAGTNTLTCPTNINSACSFLIKYNNTGNLLWANSSVCSCGPTFTYTNIGMSVCNDKNGNSFVAGACGSSSQGKTFISKYDPSGTFLWGRSPITASGDMGYAVSCDTSNNVYLAGVFTSSVVFWPDTLLSTGSANVFLVKYDKNGNQLWARSNSSGSVYNDAVNGIATSVSAEPNGNVFLTGGFVGPSMVLGSYTLTGNPGMGNVFLAKYDAAGNVLWAKSSSASTSSNNIACSVSSDGIGNAYISGYYTSYNLTFGTNTLLNFVGTKNMFLAKYDGSGNNLWVKNSINNAGDEIGYSVSSNSTTVFLAGATSSVLTIGSNAFYPGSSSLSPNAFITEFDVNGNLVYGQVLDDGGDDWFAVSADKYCNAYVTGDFNLNPFVLGTNTLIPVPPTAGGENIFTAKLSFSGMCVTGMNEVSGFKTKNGIYPNPNNGAFNFVVGEIENGELILFNSLGQKIHEQKITQGENSIETKELSKGLYHYVILENKHIIQADKVILE